MIYDYKRFSKGMLGSNTYVLWDTETKNALIIDSGNVVEDAVQIVAQEKLNVKAIVLTHGHYDHIAYIEDYRKAFGAPVACTPNENRNLSDEHLNASDIFGAHKIYAPGEIIIGEGYIFDLNGRGEGPEVLYTPGHTSGGICLLAGNLLFSGDTLFYHSFGRTDLGDGSTPILRASIDRLYRMDGDIIVLPGHGTRTTIGHERDFNPFSFY